MSFRWAQATTDKITVTNPLTLGAGSAYSVLMLVRRRGSFANSEGMNKGGADLLVYSSGIGAAFSEVGRASVTAHSRIDVTVFEASVAPLNVWTWLACTYSETLGCRIFHAKPHEIFREAPYTSQTVGSGNTNADTGDLYIGNRGASNTLSPPLDIESFTMYARELAPAELNDHTRRLMVSGTGQLGGAVVHFPRLGAQGFGRVIDYSGKGNNGTITGLSLREPIYWEPPRTAFFDAVAAPAGGRIQRLALLGAS